MQEHFKISTDGKATSSRPGKRLLPLFFAKTTRAEFSSEEGSDGLKEVRCQKTREKERISITSPDVVTLECDFIPRFLAWKSLVDSLAGACAAVRRPVPPSGSQLS